MKLNLKSKKTISSEGLTHTKMGVDEESADILTYYLRDKIYSNKILAPIREYICNAYDAHVEFGIDKDVEVTFSYENGIYIWKVRDYGLGLDEHDINNVMGKYGKSSKRDSEKQVGAFGVGAMSGFSYTDTFYVNSHHEGTKTTYICTLGAGDFGVSVGEIYKTSEEPTTEQGIEISFEVAEKDQRSFRFETERLVSSFFRYAKIVFDDQTATIGKLTRPHIPDNTETHGDYVISNYKMFGHATTYGQSFLIRMGGIVYPYTYKNNIRAVSMTTVVDVPIGKLTVPISRESIEDLPMNDKVFKEIDAILDKIAENEISTLTPPKFGSVISRNSPFGNKHNGVWFTYSFRDTFPTTSKHYYSFHSCKNEPNGHGSSSLVVPLATGATSHPIYIMPAIKSLTNWHKRLQRALSELDPTNYGGYMWVKQDHYDEFLLNLDSTIDISDCKFIDVKSLNLRKLDKVVSLDATKYILYSTGYKKHHAPSDYYSAQGLDDYITKNILNGKAPAKDWYTKCKTADELSTRTIANRKDIGVSYQYMTVNSIKMIEDLKTLGWLTPDCPAFKAQMEVFREKERHEATVREIDYRAKRLIFTAGINSRTVEAIKSKPERLATLEAIKGKIAAEDSTRARIFKALGYSSELTRVDVRRIMQLK